MSLTDWRLFDDIQALYVQLRDDQTRAGRIAAYTELAALAKSHGVTALICEPRPVDSAYTGPTELCHHEAVAALIAEAGVAVYVLVSARTCSDSRHHVFALQCAGVAARRSGGREGAITTARRLITERKDRSA